VPVWIHRCPVLGLCLWLVVVGIRAPGGLDEATLADLIVLFMPLCAVPMALLVAFHYDLSERSGRFALGWLLAVVPLALGVGLLETGGVASTALASGWLLFTAAIAVVAGLRLLRRRVVWVSEMVLHLGLLILPGAAVWLLVYRGDLVLGGFGGLAAVLTAAHFHAAGFGSLVMAGLVGRGLRLAGAQRAGKVMAAIGVVMVIAFASLAAGIATGIRAIELTGACLYAVALPALAGLQIFAGLRVARGATRILLVLSALGLLGATGYALMFAVQGFYGAAVPIATMLRMHGAVNAFGFLGLGLWGWSRVESALTRR